MKHTVLCTFSRQKCRMWLGLAFLKYLNTGWGFSSVVEHLPSKSKALGSVLHSRNKQTKKQQGNCE